jgi:hypothetical protein
MRTARFFHQFVNKMLERTPDADGRLSASVDRRRDIANSLEKRSNEIAGDQRFSEIGRQAGLARVIAEAREQLEQLQLQERADRDEYERLRAVAATGRVKLDPNGVGSFVEPPPDPNSAAQEVRAVEIRRRFAELKPVDRQSLYLEAAKSGHVEVTAAVDADPFGSLVSPQMRASVEQLRIESSPWAQAIAEHKARLDTLAEIDDALERLIVRGAEVEIHPGLERMIARDS